VSGTGLIMLTGVTPVISVEYIGFVDAGSPAGATGSTFTLNSTNIGGPGLIVLGVSTEGSTTPYTLSTITLNGTSATSVNNPAPVLGSNYTSAGLFQCVIASGSTANIVVTFSTVVNRTRIGIWRITNYNSTTPISTNTSNAASGGTSITTTLTSMQSGAGVVGVCTTGDVTPHTWTGLTENYDSGIASSVTNAGTEGSGASRITFSSSNLDIVVSASSAGQALILTAAAWR